MEVFEKMKVLLLQDVKGKGKKGEELNKQKVVKRDNKK